MVLMIASQTVIPLATIEVLLSIFHSPTLCRGTCCKAPPSLQLRQIMRSNRNVL
jgi:hypothetical protein